MEPPARVRILIKRDPKRQRPNGNGATTGYQVLTLVLTTSGPQRELWGISRGLDMISPRRLVLHSFMPFEVQRRFLRMLASEPVAPEYIHRAQSTDKLKQMLVASMAHAVEGMSKNEMTKMLLNSIHRAVEEGKRDEDLKQMLLQSLSLGSVDLNLTLQLRCGPNQSNMPSCDRLWRFPFAEVRLGSLPCDEFMSRTQRVVERRLVREAMGKMSLCGSIKRIQIGHYIERLQCRLPFGLRVLELGDYFNGELELPASLKKIFFGCDFDQANTRLPEGLEEVTFGNRYNQPIVLPASLKKVEFCSDFDQPLEVPAGLRSLVLGEDFNQPLKLFEGLEELTCGFSFNKRIVLPSSLKKVTFGYCFNRADLRLPKGLEEAVFRGCFNQPLELPEGLQRLKLSGSFNQPNLILPSTLKSVQFHGRFMVANEGTVTLPRGLERVVVFGYCLKLRPLPPLLRVLDLEECYSLEMALPVLPPSLRELRLPRSANFAQPLTPPHGVEVVVLGPGYSLSRYDFPHLPSTLKKLIYWDCGPAGELPFDAPFLPPPLSPALRKIKVEVGHIGWPEEDDDGYDNMDMDWRRVTVHCRGARKMQDPWSRYGDASAAK